MIPDSEGIQTVTCWSGKIVLLTTSRIVPSDWLHVASEKSLSGRENKVREEFEGPDKPGSRSKIVSPLLMFTFTENTNLIVVVSPAIGGKNNKPAKLTEPMNE